MLLLTTYTDEETGAKRLVNFPTVSQLVKWKMHDQIVDRMVFTTMPGALLAL